MTESRKTFPLILIQAVVIYSLQVNPIRSEVIHIFHLHASGEAHGGHSDTDGDEETSSLHGTETRAGGGCGGASGSGNGSGGNDSSARGGCASEGVDGVDGGGADDDSARDYRRHGVTGRGVLEQA